MSPETPLRNLPVAVLDVETTALSPGYVVEVAVVHVELGGAPRVAFSSLVRPPVPIPDDVVRIHGIDDARVKDAPTWADVATDVANAMADRVACAYNAPFDFAFVKAEQERAGRPAPRWPWLDPFVFASVVDKYRRGKRLVDVCSRRGITLDAHGAAGDALATALVLRPLLRDAFTGHECTTMGPLLAWQRRTALALERDRVDYLARAGTHGPRPACPWHEIEGVEPPPWDAPAVTTPCETCGAPTRISIAKGGGVVVVNADGSTHAH